MRFQLTKKKNRSIFISIDFFKSLNILNILFFYFHSLKTGHRFYLHPGCTSLLTFNAEYGGTVRSAFGLDGPQGHLQPQ